MSTAAYILYTVCRCEEQALNQTTQQAPNPASARADMSLSKYPSQSQQHCSISTALRHQVAKNRTSPATVDQKCVTQTKSLELQIWLISICEVDTWLWRVKQFNTFQHAAWNTMIQISWLLNIFIVNQQKDKEVAFSFNAPLTLEIRRAVKSSNKQLKT